MERASLGEKTALMVAIEQSDLPEVRRLLESGYDVDQQNDLGYTACMYAVTCGAVDFLELLSELEVTSSLDLVNKYGDTALVEACRLRQTPAVEALLSLGASADFVCKGGQTALLVAARNGELACVELLLGAGASVNMCDDNGMTAAMTTAKNGHKNCLESLLNAGSDPNCVTGYGITALMLAAEWGNTGCIETLVRYGVNVNATDKYGNTALIAAARNNNIQSITQLVKHGSSVDYKGDGGCTALMEATRARHSASIQTLIDSEANKNETDNRGFTALMIAAEQAYYDCVALLIRLGANVHIRNNRRQTALNIALAKGHTHCASHLVRGGAIVDSWCRQEETGLTLLATPDNSLSHMFKYCDFVSHDFCHLKDWPVIVTIPTVSCHYELLKTIKQQESGDGSDINLRVFLRRVNTLQDYVATGRLKSSQECNTDSDYESVYQFVVSRPMLLDCIRIVIPARVFPDAPNFKTVLRNTANVGIALSLDCLKTNGRALKRTDRMGNTVLMIAIRDRNLPCLKFILQGKPHLDIANHEGVTPLTLASKIGFHECIEHLIKARASPNLGQYEKKALMAAVLKDKPKCLRLLIDNGADLNAVDRDGRSGLFHSVRLGHTECFLMLVEAGAAVNLANHSGKTPLMVATEEGNTFFVITLVQAGADVNLRNENGHTALITAVRFDKWECFESLLQLGGDLTIRDKQRRTVLMRAVTNLVDDECISHLLSCDVDVNAQDSVGRTALMMACELHWQGVCVARLIRAGADVNLTDNSGKTALMYAAGTRKRYGSDTFSSEEEESTFSAMGSLSPSEGTDGVEEAGGNSENSKGEEGDDDTSSDSSETSVTPMPISNAIFYLADAGALVNVQDNEGTTPLMLAAKAGIDQCVRCLLNIGADVNIKDHKGKTALMIIAATAQPQWLIFSPEDLYDYSWVECMAMLVEHGASVNEQDKEGKTALMQILGTDPCHIGVLAYLLGHPLINYEISDTLGRTVMAHAFALENQPSFSYTSLPNIVNAFSFYGISTLIRRRNRHVLEQFADYFNDLDIHHAGDIYNVYIVRVFVSNGVFPRFARGKTFLDFALHHMYRGILRYLIANCFLNQDDLRRLYRRETIRGNLHDNLLPSDIVSQPWPLVKLAFIATSTALGTGPGRLERIAQTELPDELQDCLRFERPVSLVPVDHWEDIPLCFDPNLYFQLPNPHPLRDNWPYGQLLGKCSCSSCEGKEIFFLAE